MSDKISRKQTIIIFILMVIGIAIAHYKFGWLG